MSQTRAREASPLYRRIHDRIRGSIADGRLAPGDLLPSTRSLADELGVARGSVDAAYALLASDGVVVASGRNGTRVAPARPAPASTATVSTDPHDAARAARERLFTDPLPLTPGLPALDLFPRQTWSRLVSQQARALSAAGLRYPDARGAPALRAALCAQLAVSRNVACDPAQVLITGGFQSALGLITRVLIRPGDPVWMEDPGFAITRRALALAGAAVVPVPIDPSGLDVAAGMTLAPVARLCVVTPAHHFPSGVSMSLPRRQALLAWAHAAGAWIVEDDYDGEFSYGGPSLPALKSLDRDGRVIYAGTFSKTLFPGLRLGYIVVPQALSGQFHDALRLLDGGRGQLEQAAVTSLLTEGHFARHVARMRRRYAARRSAFATALTTTFGAGSVPDPNGGLQLLLHVGAPGDAALAERARAAGLGPLPLSAMRANVAANTAGQALILGFANVAEATAPAMAQRLHEALAR